MKQTTYSFLDSVFVFSHPSHPVPISVVGEGAGSLTVAYDEVRTAMEVAADGAVMVSKQAGNTGTVQIQVLQTSTVHKELLRLFNQLVAASPGEWAQGSITMKNITDGTGHYCTGVAFQKIPDKAYAKQGGNITWTLMCADILSLTN